jgi:hypothetical protein
VAIQTLGGATVIGAGALAGITIFGAPITTVLFLAGLSIGAIRLIFC